MLPIALAATLWTGNAAGPAGSRAQALADNASAPGYRGCKADIDLGTPADPLSNCEWWLADTYTDGGVVHYGTGAAAVWPRTQGAGVTVAIVDTGVEPDHPDLLPNLLNAQGYDFWKRTVAGSDGYGHGTLVAGIVAAAEGNGGYVGVAPQARILPVKIMGPNGEFSERAAVAGTMFAIRSRARVLNLSWGGYQVSIGGMQAALAAAARRGKLVAIAAGNNGADLDGGAESPDSAGYATSITVANASWLDRLAGDSNFGRFHVQIAAPGSGIEGDYPTRWYGGGSGTSYAAPQVAGVAALLFGLYPSASAAQVRRALLVGGRRLPQLRGKVECGCLLNAPGALAAMATPDRIRPSAFTVAVDRRPGGRIRLRWTPARDAELEGYKLIVDGTMRAAYPPSTHRASLQLGGGRHTWKLVAYDLSDNETRAALG